MPTSEGAHLPLTTRDENLRAHFDYLLDYGGSTEFIVEWRALALKLLEHGTAGYYNAGCRCDLCKRAVSLVAKARWASDKKKYGREAFVKSILEDEL